MFAIGSQRRLFDIPEGVAYFNTAYSGPQLNASRDRLFLAAGAKSHPWDRLPADFFDDAERVRVLAGDLFGGGADGWAVIPAASYGVSTAARVLEPTLKSGDRILVMSDEFPSNVLPWLSTARARGCEVITTAPVDGDWTTAVVAAVRPGVRVVAACHCHWTNGAGIDLAAVGAACRAVGAALVLDVTQSLGAAPLDLAAVDPDFLVAAGYKWLLSPYGMGLMYVAPRWRGARPLEETWLARDGADDFASLVHTSDRYRPGARRFDGGETCVTTVLPGAIAALEQLSHWGVARVAASRAISGSNSRRTSSTSSGLVMALTRSRPVAAWIGRGPTKVPLPTWRQIRPSASRISSPSRKPLRLTPSSPASSRSGGRRLCAG